MTGKGDIAQVDLVDHRRVPVRDQRQGNQHQAGDKREHQEAHDLHHQVFTKPDNKGHQQQQEQRHHAAVQRRQLELVFPEGHKGVGNGDAVNPKQRANGEEVEEGDHHPAGFAKMLFHRFGDVAGDVAAGEAQTRQRAVAVKRNRERKNQHQQDRDQSTKACANGEEQHACANGGTKQAERPCGIRLTPGGRFCLANDNAFSVAHRSPLCVNEAGNLGNTGEIDIAAGNNADGFTTLNIVVKLAA